MQAPTVHARVCDATLGARRSEWEAANQNLVGGGRRKKKLKVDGNAKMQNLVERLSSNGLDGKNFRETHFSIVCIIFNMKRNEAFFKIYTQFGV